MAADETVHILGEGGGIFELSVPLHETIADKLAKGLVRRVNSDGTPYDEHARPAGTEATDSRPGVRAGKEDWVVWAVAESERRGEPITVDDAQALTKDVLIERYGVKQETPTESDEDKAAREAAEAAGKGTEHDTDGQKTGDE